MRPGRVFESFCFMTLFVYQLTPPTCGMVMVNIRNGSLTVIVLCPVPAPCHSDTNYFLSSKNKGRVQNKKRSKRVTSYIFGSKPTLPSQLVT